jgi:predicted LPLAT superfamily acyltransferase
MSGYQRCGQICVGSVNVVEQPKQAGWRQVSELGSTWAMLAMAWLATALGRRPARLLLRLIVAYYFLTRPRRRRFSRDYLAAMGLASGWRDLYRHQLRFAECTMDRLFFLQGRLGEVVLQHHGHGHLEALAARGQGALVLGAHLGSFESLRCLSGARDVPVQVVADVRNAARLHGVLSRLGGRTASHFIDAGDAPEKLALEIRAALARGEMVAILADRVAGQRRVTVPFLGRPAAFPAGPFLVAMVLKCPVYLAFGLYHAPGRYDLYCEPLVFARPQSRHDREAALLAMVTQYAARLEHHCRLAPDNWFNFFDFFALDASRDPVVHAPPG